MVTRQAAPPRAAARPLVAIQPLGAIDSGLVGRVCVGVERVYNVDAMVLPDRPLPADAYFKESHRYSAETLLRDLDRDCDSRYDKVLALTSSDISISGGSRPDKAIAGYGLIGRRPCVVSTFRLGHGDIPLMESRYLKIAIHELGHTFGLPHCATAGCIMEDKHGTLVSVDAETGSFCPSCRLRLGAMLNKECLAAFPTQRCLPASRHSAAPIRISSLRSRKRNRRIHRTLRTNSNSARHAG